MRESLHRVSLTQERKSSRILAKGQRYMDTLGNKLSSAEAKHNEQLRSVK